MEFAWNRNGSVTLDVQGNSATAMQEPRYGHWGRNISTLGGNVLSSIPQAIVLTFYKNPCVHHGPQRVAFLDGNYRCPCSLGIG